MSDDERPAHGFTGRDVTDYPADDAAIRMMPMPVGRPGDPDRPRRTATRRDGSACDIRRSLGAEPAGPADPEETVRDWRPV